MSLAKRFELPYSDFMQDWEWEVADPLRIDEFLEAYESDELTEDECFVLMETILQSFEELETFSQNDKRWQQVLEHLSKNAALHMNTLWYWSGLNSDFNIAPLLYPLWKRHHAQLA